MPGTGSALPADHEPRATATGRPPVSFSSAEWHDEDGGENAPGVGPSRKRWKLAFLGILVVAEAAWLAVLVSAVYRLV